MARARLVALAGFVVRTLQLAASYRLKLALGVAGLVASVALFACVGRVVAAAGAGFVERFGMSYTSFAIVGVILHGVGTAGLASFRAAARREQLLGTLETIATHVSAPSAVVLGGVAELLVATLGGAATLAAAIWALGLPMRPSAAALAAAVLYVVTMCGLGLASGGAILVSKEGDPVAWLVSTAAALGGGVYFPVEFLPAWARRLSLALPTTHALAIVRSSCVVGPDARASHGPAACGVATGASLILLLVFAAASLVVGACVLRLGARRAVRDGTLGGH